MSRSGYSEDGDYQYCHLWEGTVERSIRGKRGQAFLKELAKEMDAMPVKRLIASELISKEGEVCAIGVYCKAKNIDVKDVDIEDRDAVGKLVNISGAMAAEIEYWNDDDFNWRHKGLETPEQRWTRMRKWVEENLVK